MMLNHTENQTQWLQNYSILMDRAGSFKIAFLLHTTPTEGYIVGGDYLSREDIIFSGAKKEIDVWVNVY